MDIKLPDITSRVRLDTSDMDDAVGRSKSALGGLGKALAGGLAAVGAAGLFKDVIGGASDLNETISKSNTIFGENAKEIERWAGGAAKAMGQSKQGALDAAATFGNLFVQLGTGTNEAAKMSTQMVGLASDFASFHNADPTDVIESMTAAFRGEYDAVQKYVPTINAAAVEQEGLKLGLAKTTKELTAQDKALATQSLLMAGAGAAMGDFARTSDGLANRQRILGAQFQDMKDKIGTALLPVVLRAMEAFLGLGKALAPIGGFIKHAFAARTEDITWLDKLVGGVRALAGAFQNAGDGITSSGFAGHMERIGIAARGLFEFIRDNVQPILIGLVAGFLLLSGPLVAIGAAVLYAYTRFESFREVINAVVGFVVDTAIPAIAEFVGFIIEQFSNLVGAVQERWAAISEAIGHVIAVVTEVVGVFIDWIQLAWKTWGDEILNIATIVWDQVRNVIETALGIIRGVIDFVLAVINGEWGEAWNAIKDILATVWEGIRETLVNALRYLREVVEAGLSGVVAFFGEIPGRILDALGDVGSFLWEKGRDIVRGLISGIGSMARAVVNALLDLIPGPLKKFANLLGIDSPSKVFKGFGVNIGQGLVLGIAGTEAMVTKAAESLAGAASAALAGTAGGAVRSTSGLLTATSSPALVQNFYVSPSPGMDERELGQIAAREAAWAASR